MVTADRHKSAAGLDFTALYTECLNKVKCELRNAEGRILVSNLKTQVLRILPKGHLEAERKPPRITFDCMSIMHRHFYGSEHAANLGSETRQTSSWLV